MTIIKILNKIESFKNQNFFILIDKIHYISPKQNIQNYDDYESDSTNSSLYSDISDF